MKHVYIKAQVQAALNAQELVTVKRTGHESFTLEGWKTHKPGLAPGHPWYREAPASMHAHCTPSPMGCQLGHFLALLPDALLQPSVPAFCGKQKAAVGFSTFASLLPARFSILHTIPPLSWGHLETSSWTHRKTWHCRIVEVSCG